MKALALDGQRFGMLLVQSREPREGKRSWWCCLCDCGTTSIVMGKRLVNGHTTSCGCKRRTHGASQTRAYKSWTAAKDRCTREGHEAFPHYGGRGIRMCVGWSESFATFLADLGPRPIGMTLDRIDGSKGYDCGKCADCVDRRAMANCRWATPKEQRRNSMDNRLLTFNGQTHPMVVWAEKVGIRYGTLCERIRHGWSVERALLQRVRA